MTIFGIEISDKIYLPIFIVLGAYVLDMIINKILSLRIVINKNIHVGKKDQSSGLIKLSMYTIKIAQMIHATICTIERERFFWVDSLAF